MNSFQLFCLISATISIALGCSRTPVGTNAGKSPADDRYVVSIAGNPQNFEPGQKYNISIMAVQGTTFIGFMLAVESDNVDPQNPSDTSKLGYFEMVDFSETRFSDKCANLVTHTNMLPKSRVNVIWTAPSPGSGCVLIRATVIEHREVWYMDDGFLTKQFCEEQQDDIDNQPTVMDPCCACDEAKYELTFEGKWSRHTHPKDFPANSWRTRFSDIIGASHTIDYRFWQYGELSSDGLREVAEHGSTRTLESELKEQSDQIRTIIKARGIAHPHVTGKTFAVFRVDSKHHLISLVSMVDPSPDWIVGVSGLELCLPNCSWVEHKIHNLYPWDAGTDSGPSYMSADQPQVPPDVIRRIKSNFPNDPRSPFYDPSGSPMKPLARLHISRRRLYEKNCENIEAENDPTECATHPWGKWSECSTKCGPGKQYRSREFKNSALAQRFKCRNTLRDEQTCRGRKCGDFDDNGGGNGGGDDGDNATPECALSEFSDWSSCSVTCGKGTRMKSRFYLNRKAKKKCQTISRPTLQITEECEAANCGGDINNGENNNEHENKNEQEEGQQEPEAGSDENENVRSFGNYKNSPRYGNPGRYGNYGGRGNTNNSPPPECEIGEWSIWTPCSSTCGVGQQSREREVWNRELGYDQSNPGFGNDACSEIKRIEIVNCTISDCDEIVPDLCYVEPTTGPCRGTSNVNNFWYYDYKSDICGIFFAGNCQRNTNKFTSKETCEKTCKQKSKEQNMFPFESLRLEQVDCVVSDWKAKPCNVTCGEGYQIKTREVLRSPKNGGKGCPKKLVRIDKCFVRCPDEFFSESHYRRRQNSRQSAAEKECSYSEWSAWSPCTASCGDNSVRQRTRVLLDTELSYKCTERVLVEKCQMMPCLQSRDCRGPYC